MRTLDFGDEPRVAISGSNASVFYATHWLSSIGIGVAPLDPARPCPVVVAAGDCDAAPDVGDLVESDCGFTSTIALWDFQTGWPGTGLHAAAASGVAWVIGHADGPPRSLPVDIPEKWCGLVGANLALASLLGMSLQSPSTAPGARFDVSAADVLRSFADQNAGNPVDVDAGWRRNGSIAVDHGGIYPQGFFPCRDGHVAMLGRSRRDWQAIRDVIGRPPWADEERFEDPFLLAFDSREVDTLLSEALARFDRDELLARSIETGATLAPVYEAHELDVRGIVRSEFFESDGTATLPFEILPRAGHPATPSVAAP